MKKTVFAFLIMLAFVLGATVCAEESLNNITIDYIPNQIYDSESKTPEVIVRDGDNILIKGEDYTVGYENNTEVGKANVKVVLKNNYEGTVLHSFYIDSDTVKHISKNTIVAKGTGAVIDEDKTYIVTDQASLIVNGNMTINGTLVVKQRFAVTGSVENNGLIEVYGEFNSGHIFRNNSVVTVYEGGTFSNYSLMYNNGEVNANEGGLIKLNTKGNILGEGVINGTTESFKYPDLPDDTPIYTVTFVYYGDTTYAQNVRKGTRLTPPELPERFMLEFEGWYTDRELTEKYDFDSFVTDDMYLYAKWVGTEQDESKIPFSDISEDAEYYDSVVYVYENEIMDGMLEDTFAPDLELTRAMAVTVLYRLENKPAVTGITLPFEDVKEDMWYTDALKWAYENKIINGMSESVFAPDALLTREQLSALIYRYICLTETPETQDKGISQYEDADKVSEWAKDYYAFAVSKGFIKPFENSLRSGEYAKRYEVAVAVSEMAK